MWPLAVLTGDRFNVFFSEEMYGWLDLFCRAEKNFPQLQGHGIIEMFVLMVSVASDYSVKSSSKYPRK